MTSNECSIVNSKLAYLLSICDKFKTSMVAELIKTYKHVSTRHYFNIIIRLHEPSDVFEIKDIYYKFANSHDPILGQMLQLHNNEILENSEWGVEYIYEKLSKSMTPTLTSVIAMSTIVSLYKQYIINNNFKYVFVPVIIDYGRDSNFVHQAAVVISKDTALFYEPYGLYKKYGVDYAQCVKQLFGNIIDINAKTYHEYYKLSSGVQKIILDKNNANVNYKEQYDNLLKKIQTKFPSIKLSNLTDADGDKTFGVVEMLMQVDEAAIDTDEYNTLLIDIMRHYCMYNSKTCVSITLVEMCNLLNGGDIMQFYAKYDTETPNVVLLKMLGEFFDKLKETDRITKIINENIHMRNVCKKLNTLG